MSTPAWSRLLPRRADGDSRLRAALEKERAHNRALEQRLAELQAANEGAYRAQHEASGGPRFEGRQPASWGLTQGESR